jgi:hypothetical protein
MSLCQLFLTVCVAQVAGEILYVFWKAHCDAQDWDLSGTDQKPAAKLALAAGSKAKLATIPLAVGERPPIYQGTSRVI